MSAGIEASGALSRARDLMRQGALDAADAIVDDALPRAPRDGDPIAAMPPMTLGGEPGSVSVVICSIDDAKHDRAVALYRRLFTEVSAPVRHEIISIRNARSLAEAYNWAVRKSVADVIVLSHD